MSPKDWTKDEKGVPGTWKLLPANGGKKQLILLTCPSCKGLCTLHNDGDHHSIADDGVVTPSAVCPHDSCNYHEFIRLLDWKS